MDVFQALRVCVNEQTPSLQPISIEGEKDSKLIEIKNPVRSLMHLSFVASHDGSISGDDHES